MGFLRFVLYGFALAAVVGGASRAPVQPRQTLAIVPKFEENRGHFAAVTRYLARGNGYSVSFASGPARIFIGSAAPATSNSLSTITQEQI
jgi:hypothetical protein